MSLWSTARRKPPIGLCARPISTSGHASAARPPPSSSPGVTLPPEKMRALVAMYHQTETFVTRDNLDAKIAEAFIPANDYKSLPSFSMTNIRKLLETRQQAPKVMPWNQRSAKPLSPLTPAMDAMWTDMLQQSRDANVIEALYGVDNPQTDKANIGFDALKDAEEELEKSVEEDRANRYEDSDY
ncbi:hypothetical protein C8J57DRAFT_747545 [Mycena rebaudengoi]|nr:hypothetical protein C8J57DRAFT_747545 [Mycena rebaudengoi]